MWEFRSLTEWGSVGRGRQRQGQGQGGGPGHRGTGQTEGLLRRENQQEMGKIKGRVEETVVLMA